MTHRNPIRRDLDTANLARRASFARDRAWIEVHHAGYDKPFLQDVTGRTQDEIARICSAVELTGGTWAVKHGTPPDMEGKFCS